MAGASSAPSPRTAASPLPAPTPRANEGDQRVLAARGLGFLHKYRRDAVRERAQVPGHDARCRTRPGQRLDEKLLLGAKCRMTSPWVTSARRAISRMVARA
jgi:hypothetical protein